MIETHGRYVEYLQFLQTIVKSEDTFIRKTQDMVMSEVSQSFVISTGAMLGFHCRLCILKHWPSINACKNFEWRPNVMNLNYSEHLVMLSAHWTREGKSQKYHFCANCLPSPHSGSRKKLWKEWEYLRRSWIFFYILWGTWKRYFISTIVIHNTHVFSWWMSERMCCFSTMTSSSFRL